MEPITFLFLRLGIGLSMFGHGLVRMPKLTAFSGWMTGAFEKSMLPAGLVQVFSYVLPVAELLTGTLLLAGLFTRAALVAGAILMLLLIFGSTLVENWEALPSQMLHLVFFAVLLSFVKHNRWSLDDLFQK